MRVGLKTNKIVMLFNILLITALIFQFIPPIKASAATINFDTAKVNTVRVPESAGYHEWSDEPAISGDGRYVAFQSTASNLVPGDTNGKEDIFVYDTVAGTYERVSYYIDGSEFLWSSAWPDISADGRYVTFLYYGTGKIYVYDRQTDQSYEIGTGVSTSQPKISDDGRYVTFNKNISAYGDHYIYLYDRGPDGVYNTADDTTVTIDKGENPVISGDGRYIAYNHEDASSCCYWQVLVYDIQTESTTRVDVNANGDQGNDGSFFPTISGDGRYITFESYAGNLIDPNNPYTLPNNNIFVYDRDADSDGIFDERGEPGSTNMMIASVANDGSSANASSGDVNGWGSMISDNGRYVVFSSSADNLVLGDTNGIEDIFVRDLVTSKTIRVSVASNGDQVDQEYATTTYWAAISGDGSTTSYTSGSTVITSNDTNDTTDIFVSKIVQSPNGKANVVESEEITERNLDNISLGITLVGNSFKDSTLSTGSFTLNNTPVGVSVENVTYVDSTHAQINLAFDGTDFDIDIDDFSVTISESELTTGPDLKTNEMFINGLPEVGNVSLSSDSYTVNEGDGTVTVTLLRENGSDGWISLGYNYGGLTATEDEDFTGIGLSSWQSYKGIDFGDGVTSKTVTIPITDDAIEESNETLYIELNSGEGSSNILGSPTYATITIIDNDGILKLLAETLANVVEGQQYNHSLVASGGTAPYAFEITSGDLPAGLVLTNDGVITGTPTEIGTFTFTITVTDSGSTSISQEYTLTVDEYVEPLALTVDTLAQGKVGDPYEHSFTATGGKEPYSFNITSGNLPSGLSLTNEGSLTGIPEGYGTFTITVEVEDTNGTKDNNEFTLIIQPADGSIDITAPIWQNSELAVINRTHNSIHVEWLPASDNVEVTKYRVILNNRTVDTIPGSVNEYTVSGLSASTEYTIKIEAGDAAGNWSNDGPSVQVKTKPKPDRVPPKWPAKSALTATDVSYDSVTLSWPEAKDNKGVSGYSICKDGVQIWWAGHPNTSIKVENLDSDTEYTFTVKAIDYSGNYTKDILTITVKTEALPFTLVANMEKSEVKAGESVVGELVLDHALDNDLTVNITTDNKELVTVPATVLIPAGNSSAAFDIITFHVKQTVEVTIVIQYSGKKITKTITITP